MSEEENTVFCNVYIIGKDTPNKLKFTQMLEGDENTEVIDQERKYIIRNVPEEEVDKLVKEEKSRKNYFYYVYNVDDKETFEKSGKIIQKLKWDFKNNDNDMFVLYGFNINIENERIVSHEELITTAFKNETSYFELHEFNMEKIKDQINYLKSFNGIKIYFTGLEESGYKDMLNKSITDLFNEYKILQDLYIPIDIEELTPLEEILNKSIEDEEKVEIGFIYSPFDRESFTAIEKYILKCPNLQDYYRLPLCINENTFIDGNGKTRRVTTLEAKKFSLKKGIKFSENFWFSNHFTLKKIERSKGKILIDFNGNLIQNYEVDKCNLVKSGALKIQKAFYGAKICIIDLSKDYYNPCLGVDDNNYLIASDSSNIDDTLVKEEEENTLFIRLTSWQRQHYITFTKLDFESVLKQYLELQKPAKETIHIFPKDQFEDILLDNRIVGFVNEEECKIIRYQNHIFKYKVEFHDKYVFNNEMKHIFCFVDNDDASGIDTIQNFKKEICDHDVNFHVIVKNALHLNEDEERDEIKHLQNQFDVISNDFIPITQIESIDDLFEYEDLFTLLLKGTESTIKTNEKTNCRI